MDPLLFVVLAIGAVLFIGRRSVQKKEKFHLKILSVLPMPIEGCGLDDEEIRVNCHTKSSLPIWMEVRKLQRADYVRGQVSADSRLRWRLTSEGANYRTRLKHRVR